MSVPMFNLSRQYEALAPELEAAALEVLRSTVYVNGPQVGAFEEELSTYLADGSSTREIHAVGMSSGTDALLAAMMVLGAGHGDKVLLPGYSFFATAGVVTRLGATPVFVDIEATHKNICPDALESAIKEHPDARFALVVHLYGAGAQMQRIHEICSAHGIQVIEDAAQAIGTRIDGRMAGTLGTMAGFSCYPTKNLGGCGDAGFAVAFTKEHAERLKQCRNHGQTGVYQHDFLGGNFRLDAMQAALLRVKLRHVDRFNQRRRELALRYEQLFKDHDLLGWLCHPKDVADRHTYHQYVIDLPDGVRDQVRAFLQERKIGCGVYYPLPLHLQPCFARYGGQRGQLPVSEQCAETGLALPIFPELTEAEQDLVAETLVQARDALASPA